MIPEIGEGMKRNADWPPMMSWSEFAEWIRVSPGIVRGWVDKGYLPMVRVGKHRMINIVALVDQLREDEI